MNYQFVAASALYQNFAGLSLYVKYKQNSEFKITKISKTSCVFHCKDRDLLVVNDSFNTDSYYPTGYDLCLDLNVFKTGHYLDINYIMTNYAHSKRDHAVNPAGKPLVLSDSGGLQLLRGQVDFIDPRKLGRFYHKNCHYGMALDLPVPLICSTDENIKRSANLQKNHSKVMLKEGAKLINIFHGGSIHQRNLFRSIVETPEITRCAIGGIYNLKPITATNIILDVVTQNPVYDQYHVLGVFDGVMLAILVKIATTFKRHITSDSTSHIQSSINKAYHHQFDIYHSSKRLPIGTRNSRLSQFRYCPCQCVVCTQVKYLDVLGFGDTGVTRALLALHNAHEMSRYTQQLEELALNLSTTEYFKILFKQNQRHPKIHELKQSLEFIDYVAEGNLEKARKKYEKFLDSSKQVSKPPKSLFSNAVSNAGGVKEFEKCLKIGERYHRG